jgi:meso-butanediol dehydrogenase / (S,S)-butanediol dehydrogenase / diacetyl reductase
MTLDGRVAVVTGGGAGIGHAVVSLLADLGAAVAFNDLLPERCAPLIEHHVAAGRRVVAVAGDAGTEAGVDELFQLAETTYGPVDLLVCNAFAADADGAMTMSLEEWERDLHGTLTSAFIATQRALPAMVSRQRGAIITIGSINATGYYGGEAYSAGKAGLINLTQSLAVRYGPHGVRANMVMPGSIRTAVQENRQKLDPGFLSRLERWYPLGRIGEPDDVAQAVAFLASDAAAWITGAVLPVDGGLTAGNGVMTRELVIESGDDVR